MFYECVQCLYIEIWNNRLNMWKQFECVAQIDLNHFFY